MFTLTMVEVVQTVEGECSFFKLCLDVFHSQLSNYVRPRMHFIFIYLFICLFIFYFYFYLYLNLTLQNKREFSIF